jgi:hypothetical protein
VSIITYNKENPTEDIKELGVEMESKNGVLSPKGTESIYQPTDLEKQRRQEILHDFTWGHLTMYKPRREFNDLSVIGRLTVDKMSFNTYQPNDGDALEADITNSWKSRAMKPIIRNKVMSIAAHATARLLFPKVFAYNEQDEEEEDAAIVLESLQEWAADKSDYAKTSLYAIITALWSPSAIVYTDYVETYREVKRMKDGKIVKEMMLDEDLSGFNDEVCPRDELYIENWYEPNIQRQGWLIRRRVQAYSLLKAKYEHKYENFKYVKPGIQIVYNDANQTFYEVYDTNMRHEMCEEITYWRKSDDLKIIMVNGVMLTDPDNPNPRNDKMYPFDKFVYSNFDEGRAFDGKSLVFHMTPEAKIINTLYPMIIDGTYLSIMPPMINIGGEVIASDVIIPGAVTTLTDPTSDLKPFSIGQNYQGLVAGQNALKVVEDGLNQGSVEPITQGAKQPGETTAYEVSRMEQNASTILGLFIQMISGHVREFGKLRLGDILQYLTIPEVKKILGKSDNELLYKTFYLYNKGENSTTRKIKFDKDLPEGEMDEDDILNKSFDILKEQGGLDSKTELYKVNPSLIRCLKYMVTVNADVMNPMSEELERAFALEEYDRMVQNQNIDPEETARFLLTAYPKTKKDPQKYLVKPQTQAGPMEQMLSGAMEQGGLPQMQTGATKTGAMPPNKSPLKTMQRTPQGLQGLARMGK